MKKIKFGTLILFLIIPIVSLANFDTSQEIRELPDGVEESGVVNQSASDQQDQEDSSDDSVKYQQALKFLELTKRKESFDLIIANFLNQLPPSKAKRLHALIYENIDVDELISDIAKLYAQHLSEKTLFAMNEFYSGEDGQAFIQADDELIPAVLKICDKLKERLTSALEKTKQLQEPLKQQI